MNVPLCSRGVGVRHISGSVRGYGHRIVVQHPNGAVTAYSHLNRRHMQAGDLLSGQEIGRVGTSGNVGRATPHLDFEYYQNAEDYSARRSTDPRQLLERLYR